MASDTPSTRVNASTAQSKTAFDRPYKPDYYFKDSGFNNFSDMKHQLTSILFRKAGRFKQLGEVLGQITKSESKAHLKDEVRVGDILHPAQAEKLTRAFVKLTHRPAYENQFSPADQKKLESAINVLRRMFKPEITEILDNTQKALGAIKEPTEKLAFRTDDSIIASRAAALEAAASRSDKFGMAAKIAEQDAARKTGAAER